MPVAVDGQKHRIAVLNGAVWMFQRRLDVYEYVFVFSEKTNSASAIELQVDAHRAVDVVPVVERHVLAERAFQHGTRETLAYRPGETVYDCRHMLSSAAGRISRIYGSYLTS